MVAAAAAGELGVLVLAGVDLHRDHGPRELADQALERAFVIAVDHEVNDTTSQADVLLPGLVHAETEGTFTDWEGRVQATHRAVPVGGAAQEIWDLADQLAANLIASRYGKPHERLTRVAAVTTRSLPAFKAYIGGEDAYRHGRYAAYPAATFAGIWTNTIFGFLQAYILLALYENRTDIGGYDPSDSVTYVWFAQAMLMTVYVFSWFEVALRIRSGDIATDLARPLDRRADQRSQHGRRRDAGSAPRGQPRRGGCDAAGVAGEPHLEHALDARIGVERALLATAGPEPAAGQFPGVALDHDPVAAVGRTAGVARSTPRRAWTTSPPMS